MNHAYITFWPQQIKPENSLRKQWLIWAAGAPACEIMACDDQCP
jgi:hypothetical protein